MLTVVLKNKNEDVLETVGMPIIPREGEKVCFHVSGSLVTGYVHSVAYLIGTNGLFRSADVTLTNVTYYG